eukprot:TRINITY_DN3220_c5_g1_i1.p1 TRINITY_DN3220_c5_g1~~TRINITY_DN3220_c5_g1_i1.p1  ORF type:complete len:708 (+),score=-20.30 TRINITY_DN3220_c5_g1_i1:576-2699(+)
MTIPLELRPAAPAAPSPPPPSAAPVEFLTEYSLGQQLGKGAFGEVLACEHRPTGRTLACKRIDKRLITCDADAAEVRKEVAVLQQLTSGPDWHPGIVRLVEAREDGAAVYLVMEMCGGGDLFDLIKGRHPTGLPEPVAREIFQQIAAAVAYCHARGVLHRDIKPENILFASPSPKPETDGAGGDNGPEAEWRGRVRLADFGLSLLLPPGQTGHGMAGSRFYTAPEMVRGRRYGKRADVWSLGVVLCAMLTGRVPFAGRDRADTEGLKRSIVRGAINFAAPAWEKVSEAARDLVRRMLDVDARRRLKAHEVLQHPWLHPELCGAAAADVASADVAVLKDVPADLPELHPAAPVKQTAPTVEEQPQQQAVSPYMETEARVATDTSDSVEALRPAAAHAAMRAALPPTPPPPTMQQQLQHSPRASPVPPLAQQQQRQQQGLGWPQQGEQAPLMAPATPQHAPVSRDSSASLSFPVPASPGSASSMSTSTASCQKFPPSKRLPLVPNLVPASPSFTSNQASFTTQQLSYSSQQPSFTSHQPSFTSHQPSFNLQHPLQGDTGTGPSIDTALDLNLPLDMRPPAIAVCRKKSRTREGDDSTPTFSPRPPLASPAAASPAVPLTNTGSVVSPNGGFTFQGASHCLMAFNPWASPSRVHPSGLGDVNATYDGFQTTSKKHPLQSSTNENQPPMACAAHSSPKVPSSLCGGMRGFC